MEAAAALAIVDLLAHLDHQVATEVTEAMVNMVNQANVVIQLHPTDLMPITFPNNVRAKQQLVIKDQLEPKAQMDPLVMLVLLVEMANLVNKVQKVHLARMAKQANQVKKVPLVTLVIPPPEPELRVLLEVQVEPDPLVLLVNLEALVMMVNLVVQVVQVMSVQPELMENQVQQVLMETKANKVIPEAVLIVLHHVWLQDINEKRY